MRLSEAIRLGAMMKPQQFSSRTFFSVRRDSGFFGFFRKTECSCVMGAALDGDGTLGDAEIDGAAGWPEEWDSVLFAEGLTCPRCRKKNFTGYDLLLHLNDDHHTKRERIADWVESIEQQQARQEVAVEVEA